ncbi:ATP-binding protein [Achromobacter insolitus]|uniref:AlbA family DNA-binding domain-containing protein n=1 Tax=Achromobacter insolitus TaxID=217204 RepID=UPI0011EAE33C|nr:putative DNA binding domain-containing protein [Achromobacter insolitus]QEK93192.1 ATP-binding protein [Achromobacter insolitus]
MAEVNRELIEQLVRRPVESLAVEIKTWISPAQPTGQAKIVKAVFGLRNRGGGNLVIGIDDKTLMPDHNNAPEDVRGSFHVDVIQALIAKHASEAFEIGVDFVEHDNLTLPVISVPTGVRTPVAAKADLKDGDTFLIRTDDVYLRTLNANNSPSTAKAKWKDWRELLEVCFDNREADIGRFLRRHLVGVDPATINAALAGPGAENMPMAAFLRELMEEGSEYFQAAAAARQLKHPPHGSWEVALIIDGALPEPLDLNSFARLIGASNPNYTGWPIWLDSRGAGSQDWRPYVMNGAWHTFIVADKSSGFRRVDFMLEDPKGRFYSYRALEDDLTMSQHAPAPGTAFDGILPMLRVGEAIAVGLAFGKALRADDQSNLQFMFRWKGLAGRELTSWADPMRYITPRKAIQDAVTSSVSIPIETPLSAIAEHVKTVVRPLFEIFDGFSMPDSVVDEVTQKLLERRL